MLAQEALGDRLRREARDAVANAEGALQEALQEHFFNLAPEDRPTDNEVITRIANFVRIAELRLEARHAALYLANADWDLELAFRRYMEERYSPARSPLSEAPSNLSADAERLLVAAATAASSEESSEEEEESDVS